MTLSLIKCFFFQTNIIRLLFNCGNISTSKMGRTKSRPRSIKHKQRKFLGLCPSPPPRQRLEKCNIYKLCISKLARIDDPQAKLCKAVLINNTLKKLEKQPEYLYSGQEPEESMQEVDTNVTNTESLFSRLQRQHKIHPEQNLHSEDQNVPERGEGVQDTLSLCDDIIKEFLGAPEPSALCDSAKDPCENDKENCEGVEDKDETAVGCQLVSPYSYNSFLSEVYSITLRKIKYKVEL